MKVPSPLLLSLYGTALHLYPSRLRREYKDPMLRALCDAYADNRNGSAVFWLCIFADLLQSSIKEHLLMIRQQILARPIFFHALILGFILTLCGGAASATFQQMLRRGANQPQAQMADSYASEIASGMKPNEVIPHNSIDLERSLEPFAIFYNDQAAPTISTGYLDQTIPTPPPGVFNYLRTHKSDTVTWQPRPNVRIAAVIQRISGPAPGFLLAGRSLRLVEEQESLFWRMAFIGWLIMVLLLVAGAALLHRVQRNAAVAHQ